MNKYIVRYSRVGIHGGSQRTVEAETPKEAAEKVVYTYRAINKEVKVLAVYVEVHREEWQ